MSEFDELTEQIRLLNYSNGRQSAFNEVLEWANKRKEDLRDAGLLCDLITVCMKDTK